MATRTMIFQLAMHQKRDLNKAWIDYAQVESQLDKCWELMREHRPALAIFPELCYFPEVLPIYEELSRSCLIIAGSFYDENGVNTTQLFGPNGFQCQLPKLFPSPKEVMELNHPGTRRADELVRAWEEEVKAGKWPPYFQPIGEKPGRYLAILTCMDYYRLAYYIANSTVLSPHIWGIAAPSSNGQMDVFFRLSGAIHDLNERMYSIVVNSRNEGRLAISSQGCSYVMGPITYNMKTMLSQSGQENEHFSFISQLGEGAEAVCMDLIDGARVRFFARSKDFQSNPTNIQFFSLPVEPVTEG